jgi:hypothetical protein
LLDLLVDVLEFHSSNSAPDDALFRAAFKVPVTPMVALQLNISQTTKRAREPLARGAKRSSYRQFSRTSTPPPNIMKIVSIVAGRANGTREK